MGRHRRHIDVAVGSLVDQLGDWAAVIVAGGPDPADAGGPGRDHRDSHRDFPPENENAALTGQIGLENDVFGWEVVRSGPAAGRGCRPAVTRQTQAAQSRRASTADWSVLARRCLDQTRVRLGRYRLGQTPGKAGRWGRSPLGTVGAAVRIVGGMGVIAVISRYALLRVATAAAAVAALNLAG